MALFSLYGVKGFLALFSLYRANSGVHGERTNEWVHYYELGEMGKWHQVEGSSTEFAIGFTRVKWTN